jgi:lysyl-tRNA synthetase class 2
MSLRNPNLNLNEREKFLNVWGDEYPAASGVGISGMLVFSGSEALLERNGQKIVEFKSFLSGKFKGSKFSEFQPLHVLNSGDWVEFFDLNNDEFLSCSSVQLLSPNLIDEGHQSFVSESVRDWSRFLDEVRLFFKAEKFDELITPSLVVCPGTEPFLDPFMTEFCHGSNKEIRFLPTSPELHLKKCLAKGWDKIFEIRPCFRNGEISECHQPEFYMVEWYRAFSSNAAIQNDIKKLVNQLAPEFFASEWITLSVADLFQKYLQFTLTPKTKMEELIELAMQLGVNVDKSVDFDDVFFYLFLDKIEPQLKNYDCLFLHSYPPSQAALARLTKEGWGDRFEFYIRGLEIANSFNELNDPKIQWQRTQKDLAKKQMLGRVPVGIDEEFFSSLKGGMPPSCGIALGLDRLFMALMGYKNICEFRLFPWNKE